MYQLFRPLLFRLGPEGAHHLASGSARFAQSTTPGLLNSLFGYEDEALRSTVFGLDFPNPVGLAAGFDKNAQLVPFWEQAGMGFVEVGSVSAQAAKGNPRPRLFRLPEDRALINRMGLNNQGAQKIAKRLGKQAAARTRPLGVNLAKTHDPSILGEAGIADFRESFRLLAPWAGYVALNISCPNTREGKTFEDPEALEALLDAIFAERQALGLEVPILLKLSPPLSTRVVFDTMVEEAVRLGQQYGVAGFIATNTAADREGLTTPEARLDAIGNGGLSGAPIRERSTHLVRYLYRLTQGTRPIIGVGGIDSAAAAYAKIRAGASLVQLYTALVYEGPGLVQQIKQGLVALLKRDGFASISEAVGADVSLEAAAE